MLDVDVAIAGAGPGGATLARELVDRGLTVLLLDGLPRRKIGGDFLVALEESLFAQIPLPPLNQADIWPRPRTMLMRGPWGSSLEVNALPVVDLRLRALVQALIERAEAAGVTLWTGVEAQRLILEGQRVVGFTTTRGDIRASVVVDATGGRGHLRDQLPSLREELDQSSLVEAAQEIWEVDPSRAREASAYPDGIVIHRVGLFGAYSILSTSLDLDRGQMAFLAGVEPGKGHPAPRGIIETLATRCGFARRRLNGGAGLIPVRRSLDSLVADGMVLLGDAACQVHPQHGSGVASAIRAAHLAAPVIASALHEGQVTAQALWPYAVAYQRGRGAVMASADCLRRAIRNIPPDLMDDLFARRLVTPEDTVATLGAEPVRLTAGEALRRLVLAPPGLGPFLGAALRARSVESLYRMYPSAPDGLAAWRGRVASMLSF